jgi:hypothetical protein
MSAPETNVEKQTRRHKGPLIGIAVAIAFVLGVVVALSMSTSGEEVDLPDEASLGAGVPVAAV